ncbi:hypothetical protein [Neptunomonas japonica]|uniref:hypothetical protein n=1 Tax=Neptunomonas japonica TaxID=417574 RepID=UPI0004268487|nr:hypothetical protein [Neptunomonas japonica]
MNNKANRIWSIYKTSQLFIEGSEAWRLAQQYPHAVCHDTTNTVFITSLSNAVSPYVLPEVDLSEEALSIDQQAVLAAVWLYSHTENAMHLTKQQAINLFSHPAHRLWCAIYEEDQHEQFEADYLYVGAFITAIGSGVTWPAFTPELTPAGARQYMLMGLSQIN